MTEYHVTFARSARKELENLSSSVVGFVFPKIESLAQNPRPHGAIKLHGRNHLWRLRSGDYRVLYTIDDGRRIVDIIAVRHRGEVYR